MSDSSSGSIVGWILAGGGGTIIGSIVMGFIQTFGSRGKDRADAADSSVNAAGKIIDRLEKENIRMRESIVLISEVIDNILDELPAENRALKAKLRKAKQAAQIASV